MFFRILKLVPVTTCQAQICLPRSEHPVGKAMKKNKMDAKRPSCWQLSFMMANLLKHLFRVEVRGCGRCSVPISFSASYEVSQAQKALLLMPSTAKGASTSSDELNAQVSLPTDDEYHAFQDQDQLQEH